MEEETDRLSSVICRDLVWREFWDCLGIIDQAFVDIGKPFESQVGVQSLFVISEISCHCDSEGHSVPGASHKALVAAKPSCAPLVAFQRFQAFVA
jgi:hypothetical protein